MNFFQYLTNLLKKERPQAQRTFVSRQQAGVYVDADRALTYAAVWASVRLISETIASLPWRAHRRLAKGNEIMDNSALDYILHIQANDEQSAFSFRETTLAHALLRGNGYGEIEFDNRGSPWNIWTINPDKVTIDRTEDGRLWYILSGQRPLEPYQVFHLKGLGFDGLIGYPVIEHAARAVGLGIALDTMAAATFQNGGAPGVIFKQSDGGAKMSIEAIENMYKSFEQRFQGPSKAGKAFYVDNNMSVEPLDLPLTSMQFLESRKFQVSEIARWFRVPPHKLADLERSTFSNIEHQALEFVTDTLVPWISRLETEAQIKLIGRNNRAGAVYTKINVAALLRGDIKSRYDAYGVGRDKGWLSANDIRELEDMNPVPGGDEYLVQAQMIPQDLLREKNQVPEPTPNQSPDQTQAASNAGDSLMPYPNEHACRLANPDNFQADSFRRMSRDHNGKKYTVIIAKKIGEDATSEQAYRYDKTVWDASSAESHCASHGGSFTKASDTGNGGTAMKGIQLRNKGNQTAEILIYEDIGEGFFTSGITAQGFLKDLKDMGDVSHLDIRINSNGGSVFDGIAIYNALRRHPAQKNVFVDGIAASIASIIAMAGDTITMGEGTFLMVHRASGLAVGNAEDMRSLANILEGIDSQLVDIYATRTGMDSQAISDMMTAETWLNSADAIAHGFADYVGQSMKIAAHANFERFHNIPEALKPVQPKGWLSANDIRELEDMKPVPVVQPQNIAEHDPPPGPSEQQINTAPSGAVFISPPKGNAMNALQALQARAADHKSAADGIVEKARNEERPMTSHEIEIVNQHMGEFDQAQAEVKILNRMDAAEDWLNTGSGRKTQPDGMKNTILQTNSEKGRWGFANMGDFARSVRGAIVTPGQTDPRLIQNAAASTYGTEGTGPDGGFAVPPEYRTQIEQLILGEQSILSKCDSSPTTSSRVTVTTDESTAWQTSGGVLTYWGSEAGTMSQSKPALKEINVPLHKLYALVPVTDELLEDAPMLGSFLSAKAGQKLDFAVTDAIVNGTGSGQPLGILNAACTVSVAKESAQAAATIVAVNLLKMATRQMNFARSYWLCNQDTIQMLWQLNLTFQNKVGSAEIAAGTRMPTITLPGENGQTFSTIMGRPVIVTQACQTLGTVGDLILADLPGYFAPYKAGGVRSDLSMHLWFDQGLQAFRWTFRVGGQPWLGAAVNPKNGTNTLSSFVTLATR